MKSQRREFVISQSGSSRKKVIKSMNGEYSNWEERNERMEQIRKERERRNFVVGMTVSAVVSAISAAVTLILMR